MKTKLTLCPDNILRCLPAAERKGVKTQEEILLAQEIKTEGELHKQAANLLRLRNIYFLHPRFGLKINGFYPDGHSDFTVFPGNGKMAFIELKTPLGKLSEDQLKFRAWALDNGYAYFVCVDLVQVMAALALLDSTPGAALPA